MSTPRTLRLSPEDNVVVAVDQITAGAIAAGITARERVPRGHKMAIAAVGEGEPVQKYGQTIGFASKPILPGEWVHEHNVALRDFARDYCFAEAAKNDEFCRRSCGRHSKVISGPTEKSVQGTISAS